MTDSNKPPIPLALTPAEFDQLRQVLAHFERMEKMLTAHERTLWFWSSIGVWVKWIFMGVTAVAALFAILKGWAK